jgi:HD domain
MASDDDRDWPQAGRERLIVPATIGWAGTGQANPELEIMARLGPDAVMMMGDNPALPRMPERPTLLDFFRYRVQDVTCRHLLQSAKLALDAGQDEKIVMACLLHDISNGVLIRSDHGYWGAQLVAPYVAEEVAWAVQYHQPLRYFADESVGFNYPDAYVRFFGADFVPPEYLKRDHDIARAHRWYMSARLITLYDVYAFQDGIDIDPEQFTDIIGRNFRQPEEGLGFDGSPTAHMWRTIIWPNNFL